MFTGIIEETGMLSAISKSGNTWKLSISGRKVMESTKIGDSIAVDGICLTVTAMSENGFSVDVSEETRKRSGLEKAAAGTKVNLERAATLSSRLGGHIVQGHVDAAGSIASMEQRGEATVITFTAPVEYMKYMVDKGCIAVDGISLTAVSPGKDRFSVWVIPHTLASTTLMGKKPGDMVNLEFDIIAKYTEKLLRSPESQAGGSTGQISGRDADADINEEFLTSKGF